MTSLRAACAALGVMLLLVVAALAGLPAPAVADETHQMLQREAEAGMVDAQFRLGFRYEHGYGVPRDLETALKWYRTAAENGNAQAQARLGRMYAQGMGTPADPVQAHAWLSLAVEQWVDPVVAVMLRNERDATARDLDAGQLAEARRLADRYRSPEAAVSRAVGRDDATDTPPAAAPPDPGIEPPPPVPVLDEAGFARVLRVGPSRTLRAPSDAAAVARPGDLVNIDAGEYRDCAVWRTRNITIQGVDGHAHMRDETCQGKAIWVFAAAPATVVNVRFSGARVPHNNGAGIRWEGGGVLRVRGALFHNNQMGILTHNVAESQLIVEHSRFVANGDCPRFCGHGVYAGRIGYLAVAQSEFLDHRFGHHIKSRALENDIVANRIMDGPAGTGSFAINLPDSGTARIRHNMLQKGPRATNVMTMIAIGEEGARPGGTLNPSDGILVEANAFRNDNTRRTINVWNRGPHPVLMRDNSFVGPGTAYVGPGGGPG